MTSTHRVVIAGGGIAAVEALMALADLGERELDIELIAPQPDFVLRPQLIGAPWGGAPLRISHHDLTALFGARYRRGTVTAVERDPRVVVTADGRRQAFDELLIASGAVPSIPYPNVNTIGFGTMPGALARTHGRVAIIVPPRAGWTLPAYQLALLVAASGPVAVYSPEHLPMEIFGEDGARAVGRLLEAHGVELHCAYDLPVGSRDAADLADTVMALPVLRGPVIEGLPTTPDGFIHVDELQRIPGHPGVYAAGDVTDGYVKQGGLAAYHGEVAARQMIRVAGGDPPPILDPPTLRGKLVAGTDELYLRRALDGEDPGRLSESPLWMPEAAMCAWRLSRWLDAHASDLGVDALGPVARPTPSSPAKC